MPKQGGLTTAEAVAITTTAVKALTTALGAYGYTRLSSQPQDAILKAFNASKRHSGKTPIYATNCRIQPR